MPPMLQAALGSILRWGLALLAGHLVKAGVWTSADAQVYVAAGALALISLGWSLFEKWKRHELHLWSFGGFTFGRTDPPK